MRTKRVVCRFDSGKKKLAAVVYNFTALREQHAFPLRGAERMRQQGVFGFEAGLGEWLGHSSEKLYLRPPPLAAAEAAFKGAWGISHNKRLGVCG